MGTVAEARAAARARLAARQNEAGLGVLNRTIVQGAREGLEDLVALPGTVQQFVRPEAGSVHQYLGAPIPAGPPPVDNDLPTIEDVRGFTENTLGLARPEAVGDAERLFRAGARGATGSLAGPVRALPFLAGTGAVGGVSSEAAGQFLEGTDLEVPGRILAGLLGATLSGLPSAIMGAPKKVLIEALKHVPADKFDDAARIIERSRRDGFKVLGPEALDVPTVRTLAGDVAASPHGAPVFNKALEGRHEDMSAAVNARLIEVAGAGGSPREIVTIVREAAEGALGRAKEIREAGSGDLFRAVVRPENSVNVGAVNRLKARNPAVAEAIKNVRKDPVLQQDIMVPASGPGGGWQRLEENDVIVLDAAFKDLGEQITTATSLGRGNRARLLKEAQDNLRETIEAQFPVYGEAVDKFAQLSRQFVDPLEGGIVGQLAKTKKFSSVKGAVLNADEISPADVRSVMNQLAMINPKVPGQITARVVQSALDKTLEAGKTTQAFLKRVLFETPEQKANLRAMFNSVELANGMPKDSLFNGAQRLLDVLDRVGTIPGRGSPTAPRQLLDTALRSNTEGVINVARGSFVGQLLRKLDNFLTAGSYRKLAEIMTSPDSIGQMRRLAKLKPTSTTARLTVVNLLGLAREAQELP